MKKFTGFLLFGLLLLTLGFGTLTLQSAQNALSIWFEKLVPSMFLSMVLVRLLYKEHAFDHLPSLGLPALLGMDQGAWNLVLCTMFLGFPTGSVFVDEAVRDGVLSRQDAARLLYCCCFPTPGFVIISCGIVFCSCSAVCCCCCSPADTRFIPFLQLLLPHNPLCGILAAQLRKVEFPSI